MSQPLIPVGVPLRSPVPSSIADPMSGQRAGPTPAGQVGDLQITRDRLLDGSLLATFRANAPPGVKIRSDDELRESLTEALQGHPADQDVFLFGYGSLMWNPAFHHAGAVRAIVRGWSRRFCLRMFTGRGSAQQPGLMLALDRGGACYGMAFRIAAASVQQELTLVWRREMLSGAYEARWVKTEIDGQPKRALTFVANRQHERYVRDLSVEQAVQFISTGQGSLGTCRGYFDSTVQTLHSMGIKDLAMERLRRALENGCVVDPVLAEAALARSA